LTSGDGIDQLLGGGGNDSLNGEAGNDWLWGGAGDDTMQGGADNDVLYGGTGSETFLYTAGDGDDRFTDFSTADKVDLTGVTVSTMSNNVATLSDGSVLTAQAGFVWTGGDFI
jgi:Ca2+-binding RTX toxin-like protein